MPSSHSNSNASPGAPLTDGAISHLVSLTAQRDRELLDVSLAQGVLELLGAVSVGVYRLIGPEGPGRRWFCTGLAKQGEITTSDPPWIEMDALPREADWPVREAAVKVKALRQQMVEDDLAPNGELAEAVLPLLSELGESGVLEIHSARQLTPGMLQPIQTLLKVFANFQSLLESSQRDALTGLLNRQTFDATFMKASMPVQSDAASSDQPERRASEDTGYWLGLLDIDHFKRINDTYGHLIGDEVLVLLARIMRQTFRHSDRLYRFGGEEFVILLRGGEEPDAAKAFERLRHAVGSYPFPQVGQVTVSIGFTAVQLHDAPSVAFARADRAVYEAKHQGRNRVLGHEALVRAKIIATEQDHIGDVELF